MSTLHLVECASLLDEDADFKLTYTKKVKRRSQDLHHILLYCRTASSSVYELKAELVEARRAPAICTR